jgi:hypothetical protein
MYWRVLECTGECDSVLDCEECIGECRSLFCNVEHNTCNA